MYQKEPEILMVKLSPFEAEFWPNTGSLKILKRKRYKSRFSRWTLAEITCHVEFSAKLSILFRKPPNHWNWFPSWPSEIASRADCLACPFTDSRISAYEKKRTGKERGRDPLYSDCVFFSPLSPILFSYNFLERGSKDQQFMRVNYVPIIVLFPLGGSVIWYNNSGKLFDIIY